MAPRSRWRFASRASWSRAMGARSAACPLMRRKSLRASTSASRGDAPLHFFSDLEKSSFPSPNPGAAAISLGSEKSVVGFSSGGPGRYLTHHGASATSAGSPSFPFFASSTTIGSGGAMAPICFCMAMFRPSMMASRIPPIIPDLKAAFAPPRAASVAPVQKPAMIELYGSSVPLTYAAVQSKTLNSPPQCAKLPPRRRALA
mmetsp:Transcript_22469/g.55399  ORF Transcript_22469/g.55399 Transcript_22469/m.55399 type:complete len:202 (+) Transcript_22469:259-864(+)